MAHHQGDCLECPPHTFKDGTYAWDTTCVDCAECEPGKFRDGCGGPSAGTCTACPVGLKQTEASVWPCTACQACAAGEYLA